MGCPGFARAEWANLLNEAAIVTIDRKTGGVHLADFMAAVEHTVTSLEKRNRGMRDHACAMTRSLIQSSGFRKQKTVVNRRLTTVFHFFGGVDGTLTGKVLSQ